MKSWKKYIFLYLIIFSGFFLLQYILSLIVDVHNTLPNVFWYHDIADLISEKGIFNVWTPYPQLFSVFIYIFFALTNPENFLAIWKIFNVVLLTGISLLIYLISYKWADRIISILAAFSFFLINLTWTSAITISLFFDQIEYFVVFIMLLSFYFLINKKIFWAAIFCIIGVFIKVFPILIVFIAIIILPKEKLLKFMSVFIIVGILISLPFLIVNPDIFFSWYNFSTQREPWESIYSFPNFSLPPIPEVGELTQPVRSEFNINILFYIQLIILAATTVIIKKKKLLEISFHKITLALLNLIFIFLFFSKGFSSYFIFWFFPLLFLVYKPHWAFLFAASFIIIGNLEYANYLWESIFARYLLIIILLVINFIRLKRITFFDRLYFH